MKRWWLVLALLLSLGVNLGHLGTVAAQRWATAPAKATEQAAEKAPEKLQRKRRTDLPRRRSRWTAELGSPPARPGERPAARGPPRRPPGARRGAAPPLHRPPEALLRHDGAAAHRAGGYLSRAAPRAGRRAPRQRADRRPPPGVGPRLPQLERAMATNVAATRAAPRPGSGERVPALRGPAASRRPCRSGRQPPQLRDRDRRDQGELPRRWALRDGRPRRPRWRERRLPPTDLRAKKDPAQGRGSEEGGLERRLSLS